MMFDLSFIQNILVTWFFSHGVTILLIVGVSYLVHIASRKIIDKVVRRLVIRGGGSQMAEEKRENTLIEVASRTVGVLIIILAGLMVLSEIGVAIGPLLAAAGVAGIAVGFGGQYLIRDLISGLFIILENQYRVGDVVCFGDTCGLVETLSLRATTLRDLDGTVHHMPHGEITQVANLSKKFARVNLNIGVSYVADLEQVEKVVNEVGAALATDPGWVDKIIEAPKFIRVEDFADSAVVIKILGDTQPLEQWAVAGEFRRRLKIAFDKNGIEIPFPQRVIHQAK
ncbi:MAG: mechanosensitive ion channel family protein [Candidatus Paceibacterota bacterium]